MRIVAQAVFAVCLLFSVSSVAQEILPPAPYQAPQKKQVTKIEAAVQSATLMSVASSSVTFTNTDPAGPYPDWRTAPPDYFNQTPISRLGISTYGIPWDDVCKPLLGEPSQIHEVMTAHCLEINRINGMPGGFLTYWLDPTSPAPIVTCVRTDNVYNASARCVGLARGDNRITKVVIKQNSQVVQLSNDGKYVLQSNVPVEVEASAIGDQMPMSASGEIRFLLRINERTVQVHTIPILTIKGIEITRTFSFTPTGSGDQSIKIILDDISRQFDTNRENNVVENKFSTGGSSPTVIIESVRIAQRVFEPSATGGGSTDVVIRKPFAVEAKIFGSNLQGHHEKIAIGNLYVGGTLRKSVEFKIGDLANQNSTLIVFSEESATGAKEVRFEVVPKNPVELRFEVGSVVTVFRTINFIETRLSLLVAEITGCAPLSGNCFVAPTTSEREEFEKEQVPFAQELLPVSGGNFRVTRGSNYALSVPVNQDTALRDTWYLWVQKKVTFSDIGVYLVGADYFKMNGLDPEGLETFGIVFPRDRRFAFVRGVYFDTLAHELFHTQGIGHLKDPNPQFLEGVGSNTNQIWSANSPLDKSLSYKSPYSARHLMSLDPAPAGTTTNDISVDRDSYNTVLNRIMRENIDPNVLLVGGIIDRQGKVIFSDVVPAEAYLDPIEPESDVSIQGLNSQGEVVSQVITRSISQIEMITNSGVSVERELDSYFFAGTLPDTGDIQFIRVIKDGNEVMSRRATPLVLQKVINELGDDDIRFKKPLAVAAVKLVKLEYANYQKLSKLKNRQAARVSLIVLRETLERSLRAEVTLKDGVVATLEEIVDLVDAEIESLGSKK